MKLIKWEKDISTNLPIICIFQLINTLLCLGGILIRVAFFTLLERKIIGLIHYRIGPRKLIIWGISQPLRDAAKLLCKETIRNSYSKKIIYLFAPILGIVLIIILWFFYYFSSGEISSIKILSIIIISSLRVFIFLLTRWGSFSKYALLGGYRAIGQTISYEACLWAIILILFYFCEIPFINNYFIKFSLFLIFPILFLIWLFLWLAELNRTPFDIAERESELVSGYNVEYRGGLFTVLFIAEYGFILFVAYLTCRVFWRAGGIIETKILVIRRILVWIRCSFPRIRYERIMTLSWKIILPFVCLILPFVNIIV